MCCLFHCAASSLPNIPIRFPCQQFLGGYSGALVWKLRKCVISENVGGERSSVRGGMPKGRSEWAARLYIKTSSVVLKLSGLLRLVPHFSVFSKPQTNWKRRSTGSLKASYQAEPWGTFFQQLSLIISHCYNFWSIFASSVPEQPISWSDTAIFFFSFLTQRCKLFVHPPLLLHWCLQLIILSSGASVLHGDQHGNSPCPSAAFGDGGVPPASGHGLRLQGWAVRAPPPLRAVRHHWGGGGGLLHPGGGPGPALIPADSGEPEAEHQMNSSMCPSALTCLIWTWLACNQFWKPASATKWTLWMVMPFCWNLHLWCGNHWQMRLHWLDTEKNPIKGLLNLKARHFLKKKAYCLLPFKPEITLS